MLEFWRNPFGKESKEKHTPEEASETAKAGPGADMAPAEMPIRTSAEPTELLADEQWHQCPCELAGQQEQDATTPGGAALEDEHAGGELPPPGPADGDSDGGAAEAPASANACQANLPTPRKRPSPVQPHSLPTP